MPAPAVEQSSFVEYAQVLWRRRWVVVTVVLAALVVVLLYGALAPKRYDATAALLLEPALPAVVLQGENPAANVGIAPVDVLTDIQVIESNMIASAVRKAVGSAPSVTATEVGTANVLNVTVSSADPALAARAANAYVNAYLTLQHQNLTDSLSQVQMQLQAHLAAVQSAISQVTAEISAGNIVAQGELDAVQSSLEVEQSSLQTTIGVYATYLADVSVEGGQLITPATTPTHKSSPKTTEFAVFALLIGLVLGIALALALEVFSRGPTITHEANRSDPPDHRLGDSPSRDVTPQSQSSQVSTPV